MKWPVPSKELSEAILVNPNSIEEIATALKQAVEMPETEQISRNWCRCVSVFDGITFFAWAEDFFEALSVIM